MIDQKQLLEPNHKELNEEKNKIDPKLTKIASSASVRNWSSQ